MFQKSYFKEHFRTATLKIICESRPFLNTKSRLQLQYINRKGLSQSGFPENVTKYSRALNLSTEVSPGNISRKDLIR